VDPAEQDLRGWLIGQLLIDHPALASHPSADRTEPTRAEALLKSRLILPILDGLDEIPQEIRVPAISRINDAVRPGEQVVVTCRTQQYQDSVRPAHGIEATLRGAAAVELRPLDDEAVRSYLCDDAAGPVAKARWKRVLDVLGTDTPAGQALGTPLMVSLARAIYNPRPGELAGTLRDPAELCDSTLANRAAVESLLFDAFIPAAYRDDASNPWKVHDSEKWLVFLAQHLERNIHGPDMAWWQLPLAMTLTPSWHWIRPVAAGGRWLLDYVRPADAVGKTPLDRVFDTPGEWFDQNIDPSYIDSAASPGAGLARDRRGAVAAGIRFAGRAAILVGGIIGAWVGILHGIVTGVVAGIVSGAVVAVLGGVVGSFKAAWPWYEVARMWLALKHCLPWPLMDFLAEAHRRGVLRQAGAVYQFRHIELQHRLANTSGKIGSYYDVQDVNGKNYRVILVKVIDPAQGAERSANSGNGERFIRAVFTIVAPEGSPLSEDANRNAAAIGSDGRTYSPDTNDIAGYANFDNGAIHLAQGEKVTGSVTFKVPDELQVAKVQWASAGGWGSTVRWDVRR
jgi:hypothetical protein